MNASGYPSLNRTKTNTAFLYLAFGKSYSCYLNCHVDKMATSQFAATIRKANRLKMKGRHLLHSLSTLKPTALRGDRKRYLRIYPWYYGAQLCLCPALRNHRVDHGKTTAWTI